jgi:hypothetical protein
MEIQKQEHVKGEKEKLHLELFSRSLCSKFDAATVPETSASLRHGLAQINLGCTGSESGWEQIW